MGYSEELVSSSFDEFWLICARRHLLDAKDLDILMVVLTTVSLGIPFCVDFVCIDLGMTEG